MGTTLTWGTPATPSPPASLDPADGLQPIVDAYVGGGGVLELPRGTYYADPGSPSTPLTIGNNAYGLKILGEREDDTIIKSPVLIATGKIGLERLRVSPDGTDYGVKIYNGGSPFLARNWMREVWIGAVDRASAMAGLGPRDGLILDGAGVFLAEKSGCSFCRRHGLVADSTGFEPNTTLKFDMCSFVQNGHGPAETVGYGIYLLGSLLLAEFNGGNSEGNKYSELFADSMNCLRVRDFDFEPGSLMASGVTDSVTVNGCRPVMFDNCNFEILPGAPASLVRALGIAGSNSITLKGNKFNNWGATATTRNPIRIGSTCTISEATGNLLSAACVLEDYSS